MVVGYIVTPILIWLVVLLLYSIHRNLQAVKILKDIYYYNVFDLALTSKDQQVYNLNILQVYARIIHYFGIFWYQNTQFGIHPSFHAVFGLLFIIGLFIAMLITSIIAGTSEFNYIQASVISVVISGLFLFLSLRALHELISGYNMTEDDYPSRPNTSTHIQTTIGNDVSNKSITIPSENETRIIKTTRTIDEKNFESRTDKPASSSYEIIVLILVLVSVFAIVICLIGALTAEDDVMLAWLYMWLFGIGVDLIIRVTFGAIFKSCFPIYDRIYFEQEYGISPNQLKLYSRTPLDAFVENQQESVFEIPEETAHPTSDIFLEQDRGTFWTGNRLHNSRISEVSFHNEGESETESYGSKQQPFSKGRKWTSSGESVDLSESIPMPIRKNSGAGKKRPQTRTFDFFVEESPPKGEQAVPDVTPFKLSDEHPWENELHGYILSDPEPMKSGFNEPIYANLSEDSCESAEEFLDNPDIFLLKKRGRCPKRKLSRRYGAPKTIPNLFLDHPEAHQRARSYSEEMQTTNFDDIESEGLESPLKADGESELSLIEPHDPNGSPNPHAEKSALVSRLPFETSDIEEPTSPHFDTPQGADHTKIKFDAIKLAETNQPPMPMDDFELHEDTPKGADPLKVTFSSPINFFNKSEDKYTNEQPRKSKLLSERNTGPSTGNSQTQEAYYRFGSGTDKKFNVNTRKKFDTSKVDRFMNDSPKQPNSYFKEHRESSLLRESEKLGELLQIARSSTINDPSVERLNEMLDSRGKSRSKVKDKPPRGVYDTVYNYEMPYREPLFYKVPSDRSVSNIRMHVQSENLRKRLQDFKQIYKRPVAPSRRSVTNRSVATNNGLERESISSRGKASNRSWATRVDKPI